MCDESVLCVYTLPLIVLCAPVPSLYIPVLVFMKRKPLYAHIDGMIVLYLLCVIEGMCIESVY